MGSDWAVSPHCAVSVSLLFFGVRRVSRIAASSVSDVIIDDFAGLVELTIRSQKMTSWALVRQRTLSRYRSGEVSARCAFWHVGCGSEIG